MNLYSLNDPDEAPTRIHRVAPVQARTSAGASESSQVTFAGLHFAAPDRLLLAARGAPGAVLLDVEARGPPIAESCALQDSEERSSAALLTVAPLSEHSDVMLLLETGGRSLIWDIRAPKCSCLLDFSADLVESTQLTAGIVDAGRWQVAATSPSALHWGDLRTQAVGVASLPVEPSNDQPFLAMGSRGAIMTWWRQGSTNQACVLATGGGSGSPVLAHAGNTGMLPLAACRGAGSVCEPLVVSLAAPTSSRNAWDFQLCVIGERPASEIQTAGRQFCPQRRPAKHVATPAAAIRRLPGRWGPHTGRRRGGR